MANSASTLSEVQNGNNLSSLCKINISIISSIARDQDIGIVLTPTSLVIREIIKYKKDNIKTLSVFISDQIPAKDDIKYWTTFLNQDTAVFTGAGKNCRKI